MRSEPDWVSCDHLLVVVSVHECYSLTSGRLRSRTAPREAANATRATNADPLATRRMRDGTDMMSIVSPALAKAIGQKLAQRRGNRRKKIRTNKISDECEGRCGRNPCVCQATQTWSIVSPCP